MSEVIDRKERHTVRADESKSKRQAVSPLKTDLRPESVIVSPIEQRKLRDGAEKDLTPVVEEASALVVEKGFTPVAEKPFTPVALKLPTAETEKPPDKAPSLATLGFHTPPSPPPMASPATTEELREMFMLDFGRPSCPPPDDPCWKYRLDPDTLEWDYDEDLTGYAFHPPEWFEKYKDL